MSDTVDRHAPLRLLTVQFFKRFFDNDLVSPNGDGHEHVSTLLALVAVPGLLVSVFLLLQYTNPLLSPAERMLTAIPHKFLLFGCSVCVMALVACVEWDALSLDSRDHAILGPLPLATGTLILSKMTALALFAALFAAATNAIPAVAFPMVFLGTVPLSLERALWVVGVHASVSVLASLFGFVAVLAFRTVTRTILGRRLFRLLSAPLQFGAVLAVASALLVLPAVPSAMTMNWVNRYDVGRWLPPLWFVGIEETLTGRTVLEAPGIKVPPPKQFWTEARDQRARVAYLANGTAFQDLARLGIVGLLTCTGLSFAWFLVGMRRYGDDDAIVSGGSALAPLQPLLARALARHPQRQAGLAFTLQTLTRSPEHRIHFAAYLAAGAATTLVLIGPSLANHAAVNDASVPPRLYAVQMILTFFVIAGLRAVFARPVALSANWVFQVCWANDQRRYRSGVRRAVALILAAFLLIPVPFHVFWLDAKSLLVHFLIGWLVAVAAAEIAVIEPNHIPFTCARAPSGRLKKWWPAYLLAFLCYTFGIGALERRSFEMAGGGVRLLAGLTVVVALVLGLRWLSTRRRHGVVIFEEQADVTQELGLGST